MSFEILKLLVYLMPAFLGCAYYYKMTGKDIKSVDYFVFSFAGAFVLNCIAIAGVSVLRNNFRVVDYKLIDALNNSVDYLTYASVSLIAAIVISNLVFLITILIKDKKEK